LRIEQENATVRNSWLDGVGPQNIIWLVGLSLTLFVLLLPSASYVAALPFIKQEWDLNNTQAGMVYSGYMAGYALSALLVIPMTDRLATKYIFLASAVISVTTQVLFPLVADGMVSGTVLMAFAGVGLVGVYMPGLRVISERFKDRGRGMAMGAFVTFSYGAHAASLASTGGLMSALEWRDAYLLLAVASAASLPVGYLLLRGHRRSGMRPSSGRLDLRVLKNRAARLFILGYSLHAVELYAVRVWLPAFLAATLIARGTDDEQAVVRAATVGGIALTAGALGPVVGGVISDRWGRATSAAAIFALSGACSWLIGWTGDFPWAVIVAVAVVYGWAIAADSAIYSTAITELAHPSNLGSTMAVQAFMGFMGGVVGPIVVGGILDVSNESFRWGFSVVGLLAVVAVSGLLRVRSISVSRPVAASDG
jgi:MFS family permease